MPHALSDWLEGLEAGGLPIGVDADALRREVVSGDEHGCLALAGDRGGQIGAPHLIDGIGDDRAVMAAAGQAAGDGRRLDGGHGGRGRCNFRLDGGRKRGERRSVGGRQCD